MPPQASLTTKIKVQLKLAIARLRMVQSRDTAMGKASRRTMAQLLESGKIDSARIRVESIIRSDITTELHELLELYCELLLARAGLLDSSSTCDPGLEEAVKSIMYAAPKTEIKELQTVRTLLGEKFGKEFLLAAMEGVSGGVNEKVVRKLEVRPPREELVQGYLEEIARAYGVDWPRGKVLESVPEGVQDLDLLDMDDEDDEGGSDGGGGGGSALKELELLEETGFDGKGDSMSEPKEPQDMSPPEPKAVPTAVKPGRTGGSAGNGSGSAKAAPAIPAPKPSPKPTEMKPMKKAEEAPKQDDGPGGGIPDLSELERRFAALKRLG